jgi:hypothetical protein
MFNAINCIMEDAMPIPTYGELLDFLEAVRLASVGKRNKFGKFIQIGGQAKPLQKMAIEFEVGGCEDTMDQINKVAEYLHKQVVGW